jgi:hypothetical protein
MKIDAIAKHPDLSRRKDLQNAAVTVPFSQAQYCALHDIDVRVDAVKKLLDGEIEDMNDLDGIGIILREAADMLCYLQLDMFVAFRDSAIEAVAATVDAE